MLARIILIYFTLLCVVFALKTTEPVQFVEKLNQRTSNSSTFWYMHRLYTVKKNATHIEISRTDEHYENAEVQCTAKLYPMKDQMIGRVRAVPGFYAAVVYGAVNTKTNDNVRKTHYKALLINYYYCNYDSISLPPEEVPMDYPALPPLVIDNVYGFDFYYPNKHCSPCHILPDAGFLKRKAQLKLDTEKPSRSVLMTRTEWPKKSAYGYFYVYNFANGTAVVRFLSKEYEVIKEKYVGHPIDADDASYSPIADTSYVAFCYGNGTQEVYCGQYDDDLRIRSVYAVNLPPDTYASGMTVKIDKRGRSMIALVHSSSKPDDKTQRHQVSFFSYDTAGQIVDDDVHVDEIDHEYQHFDLDSWFYDYGLSQEYCVHIAARETVESADAYEIVKCLFTNEVHAILY